MAFNRVINFQTFKKSMKKSIEKDYLDLNG